MLARLALEDDRHAVVELGRCMAVEQTPHLTFDVGRAGATFDAYLTGANPTIFVLEEAREVVGFLAAQIMDYPACAGFFVSQELFYVRPDKRGTRAAASLFTEFNRWADSLNPEEVFAGIATGHRPEVAARWMRRFGFESTGQHMRRSPRG